MRDQYRGVVIGRDVVRATALDPLAKRDRSGVASLERNVLAPGSIGHAADGLLAPDADPNIAGLQTGTMNLMSEIESVSGHDISLRTTGGKPVASAPIPPRSGTNDAPEADHGERANVDR